MGLTPGIIAMCGGGPISKELSYNPTGLTSSLLISFSIIGIFSQPVVLCKISINSPVKAYRITDNLEQKKNK